MTPDLLRAPHDWVGAPLFVHSFVLPRDRGALSSARLEVTAEGLVEATLDGQPVSPDVLVPGWTSYEWRLRMVDYDVTALLDEPGQRHELALLAGTGWYCGRLGWMGAQQVYGREPGVAARLTLHWTDGSTTALVTNSSWRVVRSTTRADDLYDGQTLDLRISRGPSEPPRTEPLDQGRVVAPIGPPIVRHETIAPVSASTLDDGSVLLDFGQNIVGWLRVSATGPAGHRLVATHAEVLENGELARRPLRSARAEDVFLLSGGADLFEPTLTFHGFRYARIEGWSEVTGSVEAVVVGSDLRRIGGFVCSDELLDRFHQNVVWSLRGNTVGIPSDCPQRDERLGWTGDIAVFAPTACYLFDMTGFLRDWLADLRAEQAAADGRVPYVVPDPLKGWAVRPGDAPETTALWSDAAVWVPWAVWESSGDLTVLRESYASMVAHAIRALDRLSDRGVWEGDFQFGDWLDPTAPPDNPFAAIADPDVIATAALHRTLDLVGRAASALGLDEDATAWRTHARALRAAFSAAYVDDSGQILSDAPAVYALGIVTGVLSSADASAAGHRLATLVREGGFRINAGFAGAPYLCEALTITGHLDEAYALLTSRQSPSWLHPVELGATTIWERWDSLLDDGTVNPGEMTSFNHYALGAVADWMHRTIGGLSSLAPGWSHIRIDPRPGGGLTWAATWQEVEGGLIGVVWRSDPEFRVTYCAPDDVVVTLGDDTRRRATRVVESEMRDTLARLATARDAR